MLNEEYVAERINGLAEMFNAKLGVVSLEIFYECVKNLEKSEFDRAVMRTATECKFMPRPGEFLAFARASTTERVVSAFQELKVALTSTGGAYRSVDFEDKAINAAVRGMGGWVRLCHMPSEELEVWGRKEFERQYLVFARTPPGEEMIAFLPGLVEQDHLRLGIPPPPPLQIKATTALIGPARAALAPGKANGAPNGKVKQIAATIAKDLGMGGPAK